MGFFNNLLGHRSSSDFDRVTRDNWNSLTSEQRAVLPWNVVSDADFGTRTLSGNYVSEDSALKMSVVYASITLIADGISSLAPLSFTLGPDGTKNRQDIPQWIRKPHPEIRRFDIWNQLMLSVLAWGNAYGRFIRRPSDGVIIGLLPIAPSEIECEWDPAKPGYRRYRQNGGMNRWETSAEIFHIQGPTKPGDAKGMSVISLAREAIGLGMTLEEYGSRYFGQGSQAKIVLEIPSQVKEEQALDIVKTFERFHKGKNNWHRPAIMSGGGKIHQISIPPDDAQFLQSRDFQAIEIARWFRVPPHRVGIISKQSSWGSGLAEENMAMLQHCFRPWIQRLQDALTAYLPGGQDLGTMIELDTSDLLKGTFKEQMEVFSTLYEKQLITKNEARRALGYEKVADGDKFMEPPQPAGPGGGGSTSPPRSKEDDRERKQDEASGRDAEFDDAEFREFFGEDNDEPRYNKAHDNLGRFAAKPGMKVASFEDKADFKNKIGRPIPPAWTDVQIAKDLDGAKLLCVGKDGKGRQQSIYSKAHSQGQAEIKFKRVKELSKHLRKLDFALERDSDSNDDAAALTLIRKLGMRPGSNSETGATVQAHGATNLKAKHVRINKDSVTLDFIGKKGVHIRLNTKDPDIRRVLESRKEGKQGNDPLFSTNEGRVREYMRSTGVPDGFMLKDLRTLHANVVALHEISKIKRLPKTKTEFRTKRKEIATLVSKHLGNDPSMALSSYINPAVFSKWVQDESWL